MFPIPKIVPQIVWRKAVYFVSCSFSSTSLWENRSTADKTSLNNKESFVSATSPGRPSAHWGLRFFVPPFPVYHQSDPQHDPGMRSSVGSGSGSFVHSSFGPRHHGRLHRLSHAHPKTKPIADGDTNGLVSKMEKENFFWLCRVECIRARGSKLGGAERRPESKEGQTIKISFYLFWFSYQTLAWIMRAKGLHLHVTWKAKKRSKRIRYSIRSQRPSKDVTTAALTLNDFVL